MLVTCLKVVDCVYEVEYTNFLSFLMFRYFNIFLDYFLIKITVWSIFIYDHGQKSEECDYKSWIILFLAKYFDFVIKFICLGIFEKNQKN